MILASGCSHAIDLCICVLAKHGQNILIPRPGFPLYKTLTSVYGVQYKQYNLLAEKNWSIDLEHLESLIDENTAAIVVNNPSNPCGSVYSVHHLLQILDLAERYRKPIIADEIYDKFVFSPKFYPQHNSNLKTTNCNGGIVTTKRDHCKPTKEIFIKHQKEEDYNDDSGNLNDVEDDYVDLSDVAVEQDDEEDEDLELDGEDSSMGIIDNNTYKVKGKTIYYHTKQMNGGENCREIAAAADDDNDDNNLLNDMYYVPFTALSSLSKTVPILTCGGISKTCLIPGLRLGWIIINDRQNIFDVSIRNGLSRLTQRLMGPNSLVQGALEDILRSVPDTFYTQTMDFIFKNAKLCYERLRLIRGLKPHMPQGSMYLMVRFQPDCFPDIKGDLDFTSKLMNEESVLVLPGKCFDFPNYFRICLTVPTDIMEEALVRMREFCERHYVCNLQKVSQSANSIITNATRLEMVEKLNGSGNNGNSFALVNATNNSANTFTVTTRTDKVDQQVSAPISPLLKLTNMGTSQQTNKCK